MRTATNHLGWQIEKHTPYGWKPAGFNPPHATREQADAALAEFKLAAPENEWRVMPALGGK